MGLILKISSPTISEIARLFRCCCSLSTIRNRNSWNGKNSYSSDHFPLIMSYEIGTIFKSILQLTEGNKSYAENASMFYILDHCIDLIISSVGWNASAPINF